MTRYGKALACGVQWYQLGKSADLAFCPTHLPELSLDLTDPGRFDEDMGRSLGY